MIFDRKKLEDLKKNQQLKLRAKAFFKDSIEPFKEITSVLDRWEVQYILSGLYIPDRAIVPYLLDLTKVSSLMCDAHFQGTQETERLGKLFEQYPSVHPLRYVPPIPMIQGEASLQKAGDSLSLDEQDVYLYYLRYACVLKLSWKELISIPEDELFNFWHADTVLFPEQLDWLISYSLEEEWYAGRPVNSNY
ncbi:hypothetical protein [Flagellimonas amoyensis]|uniref:hypothetical protein n=1 Tax=Flagellimonas amoyensis TaxID=2169401 RepID=UPI00131F3222|nr:hypothetical protein [Allomuricauda amoyensis]